MPLAKISDIDRLWLVDNSKPPVPGTIVLCLLCGKPMLMPLYSGMPDQVCPSCFDTYNECARIVCSLCNTVVARVPPGVTDTGYYVRPRTLLHIDKCIVCDPSIVVSVILELDDWYRRIGRERRIIVPSTKGLPTKGGAA